MFKFQPFSKKQKQVLTWWMPTSPVHDYDGIIADGAIRSGKTLSMSFSYVVWAMENFNGVNLGMAGKTISSFRRNVITTLKHMLTSRGYKHIDRRSENYIEITFKGKTNYFYIFGGKDESSQDLIQGITLAGMFFDEVALMPKSFIVQAEGRCSVEGAKYWYNCNPEGSQHFFKQEWIEVANDKKLVYLHFTMKDNLSLSEKVRLRYERMFSGVFYQRNILGLWVIAEGVIYDMFNKDLHVVSEFEPDRKSKAYISIDYGTQNATVFLKWQKDTEGHWICVDEYYYSGREKLRQKTDSEYADDLIKFIGDTPVSQIIIDPSAASFIAELRQRNLTVRTAKNKVIEGIRFVSSLLIEKKILVHARCANTINEFSMYAWDSKAADRGEDKPIKQHDHALDALRYFCYTILYRKGGFTIWK